MLAARTIIALAAFVATVGHATAGETFEVEACALPGRHPPPAISPRHALDECTVMIKSGDYKGYDLAILYMSRGEIYAAIHRYRAAIADFTKAIAIDPTIMLVYRKRAD